MNKSFVAKARYAFAIAAISSTALIPASATLASNGYGGHGGHGECTKDVIPPYGGFKISVDDTNDNEITVQLDGGDAETASISESATFVNAQQGSSRSWVKWRLESASEGWKKLFIRFFNKCGFPTHVIPFTFYHFHHNHFFTAPNDSDHASNGNGRFSNRIFGILMNGQWFRG